MKSSSLGRKQAEVGFLLAFAFLACFLMEENDMKQGRQIQLGLQGLSDFLDSLLLECGFAVSSVQRRKSNRWKMCFKCFLHTELRERWVKILWSFILQPTFIQP